MRQIGSALVTCAIWLAALPAGAQTAPIGLIANRPTYILPPAIDSAGRQVAFGAAVGPDGAVSDAVDAYLAGSTGAAARPLTKGAGVNSISLSPDGGRLAYTAVVQTPTGSSEQVHVVDTATGADRAVVIDKEGCILPLAVCVFCSFSCVNTPHFSPDGRKVVYSVRRSQPFRAVNSDGTGAAPLPVYIGALAPAAQRVISSSGSLVFTSSAPSGPTFAASATDVYAINLDGSGLRNLTRFGLNTSIFTSNATISADGGAVAFESNYNSPDATQVWIARGDGGELRQLSAGRGPAGSPSISADGSLVAFAQDGRLWIARTDGKSSPAPLTSFQVSVPQDPVISDDGTRVAFSLGPREGERGAIYSVATAAGDPRPVYAPRWMAPNGVTAASVGSLVTVYGANLAPDGITQADRFPLPESLAGVKLLVNGGAVPLTSVTPWQANAQIPPETPVGTVQLQFSFADGPPTNPVSAEVKSFAPELFSYFAPGSQTGSVYQQAAAFHAGSAIAADVNHPAQAGETLETYGTGLGTTTPGVPAGNPSPNPPARTAVKPQVRIGALAATVEFSGLVPGLVGVYQVNVVVPAGLRPGLQPIAWQVGSSGGFSSTIAVR